MTERDTEIEELKARIAELEARPQDNDFEWLKQSNVWKRAEFAASPGWFKFNVIGLVIIFGGLFFYAVVSFTHGY